mgnify:CR=1 FL=1
MNKTTNNNQIDISETWKERFEIFEKIGAGEKEKSYYKFLTTSSSEFKALSFKERLKINFNILAFLFGPIYYLIKKMWIKGAFLFGATCILNTLFMLIEAIIGISFPSTVYYIPTGLIFSQAANYDYYRYIKYNEEIWPNTPKISTTPIDAIIFSIATFVLLITVSIIKNL